MTTRALLLTTLLISFAATAVLAQPGNRGAQPARPLLPRNSGRHLRRRRLAATRARARSARDSRSTSEWNSRSPISGRAARRSSAP